jgi:hypothetical protein
MRRGIAGGNAIALYAPIHECEILGSGASMGRPTTTKFALRPAASSSYLMLGL